MQRGIRSGFALGTHRDLTISPEQMAVNADPRVSTAQRLGIEPMPTFVAQPTCEWLADPAAIRLLNDNLAAGVKVRRTESALDEPSNPRRASPLNED